MIVNDPPVPEAGPDRNVAIDEPIHFDAGKSIDRDGEIVAWNWSFGDGTYASGPVVTHQYAKSGTYRVDLMVMDDSTTNTDTQSDMLSVRVNEPPVANAGPDQLVTASLVQFDGSASARRRRQHLGLRLGLRRRRDRRRADADPRLCRARHL